MNNPFFRDSQVAFKNAIDNEHFTEQSAGEWMYMGSKDCGDETPEVIDVFKNIVTREYLRVSA